MYEFSQQHLYKGKKTNWDIFLHCIDEKRIVICIGTEKMASENHICVELSIDSIDNEFVNVSWSFLDFLSMPTYLDTFYNTETWKVEFIHDWIIESLIPYVVYSELKLNKNLFQKIISHFNDKDDFLTWKKNFNYLDYGIASLKL